MGRKKCDSMFLCAMCYDRAVSEEGLVAIRALIQWTITIMYTLMLPQAWSINKPFHIKTSRMRRY